MTGKLLRVAIAGAGMISWHHLVAWQKQRDRVRVTAICDPHLSKAEARAKEFAIPATYRDRQTLLQREEFDILDVVSPRETHAEWTLAAAERGIAVLCQKPLTPSLAQSEALVRGVDGKCRLMVHENWRFRPWYRVLKGWIAAGDLGVIRMARMAMLGSGFLPDAQGLRPALVRQPFMQHEPRLMIAEVLIHHLDTMRFLCGELRLIGARAARPLPDIEGETTAALFLETSSGAPVEVTGTLAAPGFPPRPFDQLEIVGSQASAVLAGSELRLLGPSPRSETFDLAVGYQASFDGVIAHFVECLAGGAPFETGPSDNLETLRLVEHAYWASGMHQSGSP